MGLMDNGSIHHSHSNNASDWTNTVLQITNHDKLRIDFMLSAYVCPVDMCSLVLH